MCLWMCMRVCLYLYMYVCVCMCVCVCICICMHMCVCMCVFACICICMYLCVCMCVFVCICICIYGVWISSHLIGYFFILYYLGKSEIYKSIEMSMCLCSDICIKKAYEYFSVYLSNNNIWSWIIKESLSKKQCSMQFFHFNWIKTAFCALRRE